MQLVPKWCSEVEASWPLLCCMYCIHEGRRRGKRKDYPHPEGLSCLTMGSIPAAPKAGRDIPEPIWAKETWWLTFNMGPSKSSHWAPPVCCVWVLGTQQWIRLSLSSRRFNEEDGQANPKLQLISWDNKRHAWSAVCGASSRSLSPAPREALQAGLLVDKTD